MFFLVQLLTLGRYFDGPTSEQNVCGVHAAELLLGFFWQTQ